MAFSDASPKIWPVAPDWSGGMTERLGFTTNVMHAQATAVSQHVGLRIGPSRAFSFELLHRRADRRVVDMLIAGHSGKWLVPIWPDAQWLGAEVASASTAIPCATEGFDFVAGGKALLYRGVNDWEIVSIDTVAADHLGLTAATVAAFGPGARLFPLRRARLQQGAEERLLSDDVARRSLTFVIDEPCDWPVLEDLTDYQGFPVLAGRPDESEDPTHDVARLEQRVDSDVGPAFVYDLPDQALRAQRTHWKLFGRPSHSWFRSLAYTLHGRRVPMWLPSFASDLKPAASIAGGSTSMVVEWAGYTLFGLARHNRRDLRIELNDGTVFYRRIVGAIEAGATETLTLDSALDAGSIAPAAIRQVSFMALATLAHDDIEITHVTDQDGVATSTLGWQAVVPDV